MFEELTNSIRESIQRDMKEKFGLTDSQSEQSSKILLEKFKKQFSEENIQGNVDQLKRYLNQVKDANLKEKINRDTIAELIDKVGLSEETATRIKDLSLDQYAEQLKKSVSELEGNAREAFNNLGKIFDKNKAQKP